MMRVFVCVGCGLIAASERRDELTCSGTCRVRAHRNGSLKTLRAFAKEFDIHPGLILQSRAVAQLKPEIQARIMGRELTMDQAQAEVWPVYVELLLEATRNAPSSAETFRSPHPARDRR